MHLFFCFLLFTSLTLIITRTCTLTCYNQRNFSVMPIMTILCICYLSLVILQILFFLGGQDFFQSSLSYFLGEAFSFFLLFLSFLFLYSSMFSFFGLLCCYFCDALVYKVTVSLDFHWLFQF